MKDQSPIKLYAKNRYLLILINIILLALSASFVFWGMVGDGQQLGSLILLRIIGLFSIVFFGTGFLTSLRMIFQPAIVVDDEGIVDRASGTAVGRISWHNISKAEVIPGSNYLGITLKNMDLLLNHCGVFTRSMLKRRMAAGRPPIIIPTSIIGIDAVQLAEEINTRKPIK
jgi:hypothetical protein